MKKLLIFDFDGTLVDTFTDAGIYYNKALKEYGFPEHSIEEYKYLMGGSLEEVVTRILPENNRTEVNINNVKNYYWNNYPSSKKENTKPYNGIVELLKNLQKNKIKIAINTNKKQEMVENLCTNLFGNIKFDCIAGNSEKYPPKPNPAGVKYIIDNCQVVAEDCIYIGDSKYDFETAENAGIDAILVTWGAYKKDYECHKKVKYIVNEPEDIIKHILI